MEPKSAITIIISLLILPSLSFGAENKKKEIIIGLGGGYSLPVDATLRTYEHDFPGQLYFKEKGKMERCLGANVQYFFNREWGLQLEFSHQKASYFSHLEWYGTQLGTEIIEINHIEEPYWKTWKLSALTLSLIKVWRRNPDQRIFPYIFGGFGFYLISADKEMVLNRWRLGPKRTGTKLKLGGGLKYRIGAKLFLNLKIFSENLHRRTVGYERHVYVGPYQFDSDYFLAANKITRMGRAIGKIFSHMGIDLSLELRL
jgi:hypothetical protein